MPLGAFASSRRIMATLSENPPLCHVTTFGGHPVSCAAGLAALDILLSENLVERAASIGKNIIDRLQKLVEQFGVLKEVRGKGCLIGLVFHEAEATARFVQLCRAERIIVGWTLFHSTILRMAPPLILSDEEIEYAMKTIVRVLKKVQD